MRGRPTEAGAPGPAKPARSRRLGRWLVGAALLLGALIAAVFAVARFGALTEPGRRLIEAELDGVTLGRVGRLHVDGLSGDVWRDFSIGRLTISDGQGAWLDATDVRVRWEWPQLLRRRVQIQELAARRIVVLRRPVLSAPTRGGPSPVSVHLGRLGARVEMAPAFSYRYGLYDVTASLDAARTGGLAGRLEAASLTHAGDRLTASFDLGRGKTVSLRVDAREAQGGALAGALGLAVDQPFLLLARADGTTSQGQFRLVSRSGALAPIQASGAWSPAGGAAQGQIVLDASRLLSGYQAMLGTDAAFRVSATRAADGFFALTLAATSSNVDLAARGEADLGRQVTGPGGLAVSLEVRKASRLLAWPAMGAARFSGSLVKTRDGWSLAGSLAVDGPGGLGYRLSRVQGPAHLSWRGGELALGLALDGDGGQGSGLAAALLGPRPRAAADLVWLADGRLLMKSLTVDGLGLRVTGQGERGLLGGLGFHGRASLSDLAAARPGAKGLVTADWRASQSGAAPWTFSFDASARDFASGAADLDRLVGATPRLKGAATFDGHVLRVADADLAGAAGDINAAGTVGADGALGLKLDWRARGPLDAGPLEVAGAGSGVGNLGGTLAAPTADLEAYFARVDLPGLSLQAAKLSLSLVKGPADVSGAFTLAAASRYGPATAGAGFRVASAGLDVTGLDAAAAGAHVRGAVSLRGAAPSSADLSLSLGPGAFLSHGQASGRLRITAAPGGAHASLVASASNAVLASGGVMVQAAKLTAEGPLAALPYRMEAAGFETHGSWQASGAGRLAWRNGVYDATFSGSGRLRNAHFKTLSPAHLSFGAAGTSLEILADVGGGRARIDARQAGRALQAKAELAGVSLGAIDQDYQGRLDASFSLEGSGARLGGDLTARIADARQRGDKGGPSLSGELKAMLVHDLVTLDAEFGNAQGLTSHASLVLPAAASAAPFQFALVRTAPLRGEFSATGQVKPLWDMLMGAERSLSGEVQAQGTVGGDLADPTAQGLVTIRNGEFADSDTGLKLKDVTSSARLADSAIDVSQFSGADGAGGSVTGVGRISLIRGGASSFRLDLKRFRLIDNEVATAVASGQATINRGADGKVKLVGALAIDRADIAANPPAASGVTPMQVVEINRQPGGPGGQLEAANARAPAVDLDIALKAPGRVYVKGRGLDVELSLDAHVGGSTTDPALQGTARVVRGDYDFAGKRFEFGSSGVVDLAASPEHIRLDLSATWEAPTLTAVIRIQGTASKPRITLTSTPVLPNDEVLSQVLFGTSAAQLSPAEGAELASALVELRGGGGFDVLGNLRNFAHLDRLALGGAGASDFSISGGKYLTDKVYLELTGGGREGPSAEVDWRVRRNLSVVAKAAGAQGDSRLSVRWRKDY
ncbi:MAG TPA: translocation/assembly module TamB domain-containing protein [Caulobacteraceae bacterium]|nr:translocation/assembly module TamB domain-containing protein [Caulobacteraceae bacterium]